MRIKSSIRFSLTAWYIVTLALIMLLFSSVVYYTIKADLFRETDRELLKVAESLANPMMEPFRKAAPSVFDQVLEDFLGPKIKNKYVQLLEPDGTLTTSSRNLNQQRIPLSRDTYNRAAIGKMVYETAEVKSVSPIRVLTVPVLSGRKLVRIVQVASSLGEELDTLAHLSFVFIITVPLGVLILGCCGWFLAGQALKPVDLITRSARRISAENLSQRLIVSNPDDEIGRLAETFNSTLSRLETSFIQTRRFYTDVSHELRTPLTIIRGEIEVGMRFAKEPEEFREIMKSNLEEIERMSGIVESLLELSRAEAGTAYFKTEFLDLSYILSSLVDEMNQKMKRHSGTNEILLACPDAVYVNGDSKRLRQVFANLIENGLKHSPPGCSVNVTIKSEGERVKVLVTDSGPGISQEDLPHIFERFYRVDKSRNRMDGGAGLGLSLVKSITEAHNGKVYVESVVNVGSVFIVDLPEIQQ